jgi:hypothetical protein
MAYLQEATAAIHDVLPWRIESSGQRTASSDAVNPTYTLIEDTVLWVPKTPYSPKIPSSLRAWMASLVHS